MGSCGVGNRPAQPTLHMIPLIKLPDIRSLDRRPLARLDRAPDWIEHHASYRDAVRVLPSAASLSRNRAYATQAHAQLLDAVGNRCTLTKTRRGEAAGLCRCGSGGGEPLRCRLIIGRNDRQRESMPVPRFVQGMAVLAPWPTLGKPCENPGDPFLCPGHQAAGIGKRACWRLWLSGHDALRKTRSWHRKQSGAALRTGATPCRRQTRSPADLFRRIVRSHPFRCARWREFRRVGTRRQ